MTIIHVGSIYRAFSDDMFDCDYDDRGVRVTNVGVLSFITTGIADSRINCLYANLFSVAGAVSKILQFVFNLILYFGYTAVLAEVSLNHHS